MDELVRKIIELEWEMFTRVQNKGGRASCQDDPDTFRIMRRSQFDAWDAGTRKSYMADLQTAQSDGRNLLTEKYAYMMQDTDPAAFGRIRALLPVIPGRKKVMIANIVNKHVLWQEEFGRGYPLLAKAGRPVRGKANGTTSSETYLRGELGTYSENTLCAYWGHIQALEWAGQNIVFMIMENMVRLYGYSSLDDAERRMRS